MPASSALLVAAVLTATCGCSALPPAAEPASIVQLVIDGSHPQNCSTVKRVWRSTGLCPPDPRNKLLEYFNSSDMRQNLLLISSLPHKGMLQVRVHWLLDLVTVSDNSLSAGLAYNFSNLDAVLDIFNKSGLSLGFELMGNPSGYFSDFGNATQVEAWYALVSQLAERYVRRYGLDRVRRWNFETWNEPGPSYFANISMTVEGYLAYYNACRRGLAIVSQHLRLGGPAMNCNFTDSSGFCLAFLNASAHRVASGLSPPSFLSFHIKGGSGVYGNATDLLSSEATTAEQVGRLFPALLPAAASVPLYNDEADPVAGWNKSLSFAATAGYAAFVSSIVIAHASADCGQSLGAYALVSNDNAFLSYYPYQFTQRTLLARLQVNNTKPAYTYMVKKPVYAAMGLLSLLGRRRLAVQGQPRNLNNLSVLATVDLIERDGARDAAFAILLQNSNPETTAPDVRGKRYSLVVRVNFDPVVSLLLPRIKPRRQQRPSCVYVAYQIDGDHGNPFRTWKAMGKPSFPRLDQLMQLRDSEPPVRSAGPLPLDVAAEHSFDSGHFHRPRRGGRHSAPRSVVVRLPQPGVALLHVCCPGRHGGRSRRPGKPGRPTFERVSPFIVLIVWSDARMKTKCILGYEVEMSTNGTAFRRINDHDVMFPSYYHISTSGTAGFYRIRAVSYWLAPGIYSDIAYYDNASG